MIYRNMRSPHQEGMKYFPYNSPAKLTASSPGS